MLRVDVQYLVDEPSHSVRLTLAEKHRRTRACGVLVKSFLKSFREKHGAHLDDAAPRAAGRTSRMAWIAATRSHVCRCTLALTLLCPPPGHLASTYRAYSGCACTCPPAASTRRGSSGVGLEAGSLDQALE